MKASTALTLLGLAGLVVFTMRRYEEFPGFAPVDPVTGLPINPETGQPTYPSATMREVQL